MLTPEMSEFTKQFVETFTPAKRLGLAQEVADVVTFLCSSLLSSLAHFGRARYLCHDPNLDSGSSRATFVCGSSVVVSAVPLKWAKTKRNKVDGGHTAL